MAKPPEYTPTEEDWLRAHPDLTPAELRTLWPFEPKRKGHALQRHRQRLMEDGEETPQEPVADPLDAMILKAIRDEPRSITALCDLVDRGPAAVTAAIERLNAEGYRADVLNDQAQIVAQVPTGETPIPLEHFRDGQVYRFGALSDTHLCNKHSRLDVLEAAYDFYAAEGIRAVYHGGNWIDGEARFNKTELITPPGFERQVNYFVEHYPQREGIDTYIISGDDHEGWYAQREGIDPGRRMEQTARAAGRTDLHDLGYSEVDMRFTCDGSPPESGMPTATLRLTHGGGGSAYALSYTPQGLINSYQPGEKPNILLIGHYHKAEWMPHYRGVSSIQLACTEDQTQFMRKKKLEAHVGFWLIEFRVASDGTVTRMKAEFFPFFDRQFYVNRYGIGTVAQVA